MTSVILRRATRLLLPLLLLFSLFLLIRGHNEPGGGFAGGLVAAGAFALLVLADGVSEARQALRIDPVRLAAIGLVVALASGVPGWLLRETFMAGVWVTLPGGVYVGTPVLFDIGVYLTVMGIALAMIFALAEEQLWSR